MSKTIKISQNVKIFQQYKNTLFRYKMYENNVKNDLLGINSFFIF